MTWSKFQQDAFNLTLREVKELERECIHNYVMAQKAVKAELDAMYLKYLTGIKPEDYYNTVVKFDRLTNILKTIDMEYSRYVKGAENYIKNASKVAMSNVYYRRMFASGWLVPEVAVGILPPALIEFSVYGTAQKWKDISKSVIKKYGNQNMYAPPATLSELLLNRRKNDIVNINRVITQGLQRGISNAAMVDDVAGIIGKRVIKDGVVGYTGAKANALRIIRTETTRTMNAGGYAQAKYLQSKGVTIQRIWDATLDSRTRPSHASLDGVKKGIDEPFTIGSDSAMYAGDFQLVKNNANCRCSVADTINGNDPKLRRARNPETGETEVFNYKRFPEWAKENGLTKNKYGQILPVS